MKIRTFPQGDGAMNSLGGLQPDTVQTNITGSLREFWQILNLDRQIVNWNGDVSPIVHQLDHFQAELLGWSGEVVERELGAKFTAVGDIASRPQDRVWQLFPSTRCLFDCKDSPQFVTSNSV